MIIYCKENLLQIRDLLLALSAEQYTQPLAVFSGSSIGQHTRHILEFYGCLEQGLASQIVNYDLRERDMSLETDKMAALQKIDYLCAHFFIDRTDSPMTLEADFCNEIDGLVQIKSSFQRELAYCLEHSIHHQALLKIGVFSLGLAAAITPDFGVASSTIRHQKQQTVCVQ